MIFTVGHSTLTADEFVRLCYPLDLVLDVRSHPTSRWEQFRKENMEVWLPELGGVEYQWLPELGGWTARDMPDAEFFAGQGVDVAAYSRGQFPKQRIAPDRPAGEGPAWTNQGLYDYAWYTTRPAFWAGIGALIGLGEAQNVGIMCAEVLWWKCHRSMVADALWWKGVDCVHLQPRPRHHSLCGVEQRIARYPPAVLESWGERAPAQREEIWQS